MIEVPPNYWTIPIEDLYKSLEISSTGLTEQQVEERRDIYGLNQIQRKSGHNALVILFSQFKSPLIILLVCATILSFYADPTDIVDPFIIMTIILMSAVLGFWQENSAAVAVDKLLALVQIKVKVLRNNLEIEVPIVDIVPGDIVFLNAGSDTPGDCVLIESNSLNMIEAALTGESFPVDKFVGISGANATLSKRTNCLFMGTHCVSGFAKALVIKTGSDTEIGKISMRLRIRPPETDFHRGLRRLALFLLQIAIFMTFGLFIFLSARPGQNINQSLLFVIALAVGITPDLLPVIVTVNMAFGARSMAQKKVIVKKLPAIENFGSINVLCSDKTGTLTKGTVFVNSTVDGIGDISEKVMLYTYLNSSFQTGYRNPIDEAVLLQFSFPIDIYQKLDEQPFDFVRRRISIVVKHKNDNNVILITKGAFKNVISLCTKVETASNKIYEKSELINQVTETFTMYGDAGYRIFAVAIKKLEGEKFDILKEENNMTLIGFIVVSDPMKDGIIETIKRLHNLEITLKVITGDNPIIAKSVGRDVGYANPRIITGIELRELTNEALISRVNNIDVFAEVDPNQKERIINALKTAGNVVGFIGDGINDAPGLRAADVGISVNNAVDVAKEASDIILLENDLQVFLEGVVEGRKTFANTMKYIYVSTSANFGNMFSMAIASLVLPFLPLLPTQVLLTNLLQDIPSTTIPTDNVDDEIITRPTKWSLKFIRNYMIVFGLLSSFFDILTFTVLWFIYKANNVNSAGIFQTGWFLESVASATLIVLIIRTPKSLLKSKPSKYLVFAEFFIVAITVLIPITPIGSELFKFVFLPVSFYIVLVIIVAMYIISGELLKSILYKTLNSSLHIRNSVDSFL